MANDTRRSRRLFLALGAVTLAATSALRVSPKAAADTATITVVTPDATIAWLQGFQNGTRSAAATDKLFADQVIVIWHPLQYLQHPQLGFAERYVVDRFEEHAQNPTKRFNVNSFKILRDTDSALVPGRLYRYEIRGYFKSDDEGWMRTNFGPRGTTLRDSDGYVNVVLDTVFGSKAK